MTKKSFDQRPVAPSETGRMGFEFRDNFEGPELDSFWDAETIQPENYEFVEHEGRKALKITVRSGDSSITRHSGSAGSKIPVDRAAMVEKKENPIPPETEMWYGFSFFVPEDFPTENDNRMLIAQWKTNTVTEKQETPVLTFWYREGKLIFQIRDEGKKIKYEQPALSKGEWHDVKVSYQLGSDYQGHCKVTLDGQEFVDYSGHMGYEHLPPSLHFRMGLHRDQTEYDQTMYFGDFRRGDTEESIINE